MKSLSIAMVAACPFPANHGSPASIREMSQALYELGHKVHIITYPIKQDIPVKGIKIHRVRGLIRTDRISIGPAYYKPFFDILMAFKLCRVIREEGIDIIHAHNYEGALVGFIAKILTRRPMLYNAVNNMIDELPSYNFIKPKLLAVKLANFLDNVVPKMGDYVTVVSEELNDFILQKGISKDRVFVIPAGVNPEMFHVNNPDIMRDRYKIGRRPLIIYTGNYEAVQGIHYLVKAMRIVLENVNDAVLLLVGNIINEAELKRIRDLAADEGVDKNMIFTDETRLEELPYFLASADVAVVPRPSCPGFPVKLLNYMAAGKPIVTFKGSAKGLKNMLNAVVVEDHDWREFGMGISYLIKNPEMAKKIGENAKAAIKGNFDWPSLAEKIEKIYKKMLK